MIGQPTRQWVSKVIQKLRCGWYRFLGVEIGPNCFISFGAWIDSSRGKVIIGRKCVITKGSKVLGHSAVDKILKPDWDQNQNETVLGDNVFVGMNAVILPNVKLGDNCIVGAGAIVTKSFPANSVIGGNPAKLLRTVERRDTPDPPNTED